MTETTTPDSTDTFWKSKTNSGATAEGFTPFGCREPFFDASRRDVQNMFEHTLGETVEDVYLPKDYRGGNK